MQMPAPNLVAQQWVRSVGWSEVEGFSVLVVLCALPKDCASPSLRLVSVESAVEV